MNIGLEGLSIIRSAKVASLAIFVLIVGTVACPLLPAQTLTIRLLNAKSGKAMGKKMVTVDWVKDLKSSEISIVKDGVGHVEIPPGAKGFSIRPGPRIGDEPYRIAYRDCNVSTGKLISVVQVLEKGVVPQNTCGHQSVVPRPGEIVFWALPLPFWEPDFQ